MTHKLKPIALFDLDGTLCDYDASMRESMEKLRSPIEPPYDGVPRDDAPQYLRARADMIRASQDWWANLPQFELGFKIWDLTKDIGFHRVILTQGPRRNPASWSGKKIWIDRNLGQNEDVIITRDKSLVYGKILVDDWPEYILKWLVWRPRGLVIMPAHEHNKDFSHEQVIRYTDQNYDEVQTAIKSVYSSFMKSSDE